MLTTARQLAAGLGAPASKSQDPQLRPDCSAQGPRKVGNATLGLWIGQRFIGENSERRCERWQLMMVLTELYRRTGRDKRARRQDDINAELTCALEEIRLRGRSAHHTPEVDGDMQMSP
jgi:hypothetical protein